MTSAVIIPINQIKTIHIYFPQYESQNSQKSENTILFRLHGDKQGVCHSRESMHFQYPVLLVGCGTLIFNCHARITSSDIFLGSVSIISQREIHHQKSVTLPFLHLGIAESGWLLYSKRWQAFEFSQPCGCVVNRINHGFMTSTFLRKRAGSLFLVLTLPFGQRGHTEKHGLKAKYHNLKMKLQVSSPNKLRITRTELYLPSAQ